MIATTIRNFEALIQHLNEIEFDLAMFRGQSRDWSLLPSIGRYPHMADGYEDWRGFHDHLIERFLRQGRPYFLSDPSNEVESWVIAQHHGLPTRLLDTTTNPIKALYFAVGDPAEDEHDGVLWVITFSSWREDLTEGVKQYWNTELVPFFPAQLHVRLTAQEGSFLCYPLPNNTEPLVPIEGLEDDSVYLKKLVIPSEHKRRIRLEIASLGAKHDLLFPDLDGVARSIKLSLMEK